MLVVILGAGASFDSVNLDHDPPLKEPENLQWRPPLASELFDTRPNFRNRLAEYEKARPIVQRIRRQLAAGVLLEDELSLLQAEAVAGYLPRHQQLLAVQCYLQAIIRECTNEWLERCGRATHYDELVDTIEAWRLRQPNGTQEQDDVVTYITFNYDLMLEHALADVYQWVPSAESLDDYGDHHAYKLAKPHGSVDWSRIVDPGRLVTKTPIQGWLWANAGRYPLGNYVRKGGGVGPIYSGAGHVPAVAVPVHDKDAFSCPDDQVRMIEAAVRQATRVLCIGWRGMEKEFLAKWKNRNSAMRVLIASGPVWPDGAVPARETFENMVSGGFPYLDPVFHEGGFGSLLGSGDLVSFLNEPNHPNS